MTVVHSPSDGQLLKWLSTYSSVLATAADADAREFARWAIGVIVLELQGRGVVVAGKNA